MLKATLVTLSCIIISLLPFQVYAERQHKVLPNYSYKVIDGETFACYDFNGAKLLAEQDLKCASCFKNYEESKKRIKLLEDKILSLQSDVAKLAADTAKYKETFNRLLDERADLFNRVHAAEQRDILGGGLPWLIGAAALSFVVGGTLVFVATRN